MRMRSLRLPSSLAQEQKTNKTGKKKNTPTVLRNDFTRRQEGRKKKSPTGLSKEKCLVCLHPFAHVCPGKWI